MEATADRMTDLLNGLMDETDDETTAHVVVDDEDEDGPRFRIYDSYFSEYVYDVRWLEDTVRKWATSQNEQNAQRIEDEAEDARLRALVEQEA